MTIVTGYVRDQAGDLLADATVHLIRRDTGALLGSAVSGDGTEEQVGDSEYDHIALLLHFDDTDGSTTFTDNSPTPKTVTAYGDAKISTTQNKFGGSSLKLDGSGDYLVCSQHADFNFGGGDFTWEAWIYRAAVTDPTYADAIWCSKTNPEGFGVGIGPEGKIGFVADASSGTWALWNGVDSASNRGSAVVSLNTWTHIAFTRSGDTWRGFVNGTLDQTRTISGTISDTTGGYNIGRWHDTVNRYLNGYIDDLRITKGVARYTDSFTTPTVAFLDSATLPATPLGLYSIDTTYSGEVQRIVCAPDSWDPIANDLIDRIILP